MNYDHIIGFMVGSVVGILATVVFACLKSSARPAPGKLDEI